MSDNWYCHCCGSGVAQTQRTDDEYAQLELLHGKEVQRSIALEMELNALRGRLAQEHGRAATIEECARLVEEIGDDAYFDRDRAAADYIAKAIRALSPVPSTNNPCPNTARTLIGQEPVGSAPTTGAISHTDRPGLAHPLLDATTISACNRTITIECNDTETTGALLDWLDGSLPLQDRAGK